MEKAPRDERDRLAKQLLEHALQLEGRYLERRDRILRIPFTVELKRDTPDGLANDMVIRTRDVRIPEDKQRFKVEIDRTITVLRAVLGEKNTFWFMPTKRRSLIAENARKLSEYLEAVAGIARVGLMNLDKTQTPFAELALKGLKDEFVALEAGPVKNAYVWRLGFCALVAITAFAILYFSIRQYVGTIELAVFLWLWAGAAVGAWLSFSIRRVVLQFSDLALLEDDRLTPELRILFVVALTTIIGLMLWTGVVGVTIGSFVAQLRGSGNALDLAVGAFLIGAFCGIGERSMASAVGRRADDFAASVGGTTEARTGG